MDNSAQDVCNGNGECLTQDECLCFYPYTGQWCEEKIKCYGLDADDPLVCSGVGICTIDGSCVCDSEHAGENCQLLRQSDCSLCLEEIGTGVCSSVPDDWRPL